VTAPLRRRRLQWVGAVVLVQTLLLWATLYVPTLGGPAWHHLASLAGVLALAAVWRLPLLRSRTVLALGVAVTTLLAVASGFYILYWKPFLKSYALVDWIKWWHIVWSWGALVFFVLHTWINRVSYLHLLRRTRRTPLGFLAHDVLIWGSLLAIPLTWNTWFQDRIHDDNYIWLTWWTWLVLVLPLYVAWGLVTWTPRGSLEGLKAALSRDRVRAVVDVGLVPATVLAMVSGFPITFWKTEVHGFGYKFVGKYWHTWPSILMAVLVFAHTVQLWRPTVSHWRRWGRIMGDLRLAVPAPQPAQRPRRARAAPPRRERS
jgi:hypothetical protein